MRSSVSDAEEELIHDAGPRNMPWQAVSALASEYGNAVRETFTQDSSITTSGRVEQGRRVHASRHEHKRVDQSTEPKAGHVTGQRRDSGSDKRVAEAVQADIQRVKRKIVAADASTEVILRFNFMSGAEARVWDSCTVLFTCCCTVASNIMTTLRYADCIALRRGFNSSWGGSFDN